jgi:hypothetical protein
MAKKLTSPTIRQPGTRAFRVWVDSEFQRFTSVTASAIRNTIYLSDVPDHIKLAAYAYLNKKVDEYHYFLQVMQDEVDMSTSNSDISELNINEPVQDAFDMSKAEPLPQAVESVGHAPLTDNGLSDPRMRGIAHELGMLAECQLWEICQHLGDSSGKVAIHIVRAFYRTHMSDSKFYAVLNSEYKHLWFRNIDFEGGYIWFKAYDKVAAMFGRYIPKDRIQHYTGSNGFSGRVHMPLAGTSQVAMQYAFAAWIERRKKSDSVTLANATMAAIWDVSIRTIKRWKQRCSKRDNFAEQAPITDKKHQINPDVPKHAVNTQNGGKLYQISSSYTPPGDVQKHSAKGRSKQAQKAFYRAVQIANQVDCLGDIWQDEERSTEKRYWVQDDIPQAFVHVDKTLRKKTSDTFLPRHVRLVAGKRVSVWETFTQDMQRVEVVYAS